MAQIENVPFLFVNKIGSGKYDLFVQIFVKNKNPLVKIENPNTTLNIIELAPATVGSVITGHDSYYEQVDLPIGTFDKIIVKYNYSQGLSFVNEIEIADIFEQIDVQTDGQGSKKIAINCPYIALKSMGNDTFQPNYLIPIRGFMSPKALETYLGKKDFKSKISIIDSENSNLEIVYPNDTNLATKTYTAAIDSTSGEPEGAFEAHVEKTTINVVSQYKIKIKNKNSQSYPPPTSSSLIGGNCMALLDDVKTLINRIQNECDCLNSEDGQGTLASI